MQCSKGGLDVHVHVSESHSLRCVLLSQSLVPTRLFSKLERETPVLSVVDANGTIPVLTTMNQENSSVQKCPGLLEAIESCFGGIISFTAFVVRIYRRRISFEDPQNKPEKM